MMKDQELYHYTLQHADNCLILGQRFAEWCGHGPVLEQDIAMSNIGLDLIGQSRMWYQFAAEIQNEGRTEDDIAYLRDAWDFHNVLLVEQPNGDFAATIFRQFLYDSFSVFFHEALMSSKDETLAAIAAKSHKESLYHIKWSSDWVLRLGDGTDESKSRLIEAVNDLWPFAGELTMPSEADKSAFEKGYGVDLKELEKKRLDKIKSIMEEATVSIPDGAYMHEGGKTGRHSEYLGYILADLQFLQRAYPGLEW